jgi:hypothetical protein
MARRWTEEEEAAWIRFFRGETITPPAGREIHVARQRFDIPTVSKLSATSLHAMATAASKFLPRIPYRGQGDHTKFIEAVQIRAVHPDAVEGWGYPKKVFDEAVVAARQALHGAPPPVEATPEMATADLLEPAHG